MFLDVDSHRFFMAMGTEGFEITYVMDFAECITHRIHVWYIYMLGGNVIATSGI